jgi:hypothetical protein
MDVATALGELSAAGSEQTRKTYRRHGAPEPLFGVSFATLRALAKRSAPTTRWPAGCGTPATPTPAPGRVDRRSARPDATSPIAGPAGCAITWSSIWWRPWSRARRWPSSAWRSGSAATTSSSRAAAGR